MTRRRPPNDARSHAVNVRSAKDSSSPGPIDFTRLHHGATVSGGAGTIPPTSGLRAASANIRSSDCRHSAPPMAQSAPRARTGTTRHRFGPSIAGETVHHFPTTVQEDEDLKEGRVTVEELFTRELPTS
jgi:hypothetical protein